MYIYYWKDGTWCHEDAKEEETTTSREETWLDWCCVPDDLTDDEIEEHVDSLLRE